MFTVYQRWVKKKKNSKTDNQTNHITGAYADMLFNWWNQDLISKSFTLPRPFSTQPMKQSLHFSSRNILNQEVVSAFYRLSSYTDLRHEKNAHLRGRLFTSLLHFNREFMWVLIKMEDEISNQRPENCFFSSLVLLIGLVQIRTFERGTTKIKFHSHCSNVSRVVTSCCHLPSQTPSVPLLKQRLCVGYGITEAEEPSPWGDNEFNSFVDSWKRVASWKKRVRERNQYLDEVFLLSVTHVLCYIPRNSTLRVQKRD